jgi:hypothetical protein
MLALLTAEKHHDDAEGLLEIGVGGHVAEADRGQRAHCVVESGDVDRALAIARQEVGVIGGGCVEAVLLSHSVKYGQPAIVKLERCTRRCSENESSAS